MELWTPVATKELETGTGLNQQTSQMGTVDSFLTNGELQLPSAGPNVDSGGKFQYIGNYTLNHQQIPVRKLGTEPRAGA